MNNNEIKKKIQGKQVMVKGNILKYVEDLTDDDEVLIFVLVFDGVTAQHVCV